MRNITVNFLRYGEGDNNTIDIADVAGIDLLAIGEVWTQELVAHSEQRRRMRQQFVPTKQEKEK